MNRIDGKICIVTGSTQGLGAAIARRLASTIACRLVAMALTGRPRSPSLAPSSMTTTLGLWVSRAAGRRARPPAVVSPLMLAFTTLWGSRAAEIRSASSAGQLCWGRRP